MIQLNQYLQITQERRHTYTIAVKSVRYEYQSYLCFYLSMYESGKMFYKPCFTLMFR